MMVLSLSSLLLYGNDHQPRILLCVDVALSMFWELPLHHRMLKSSNAWELKNQNLNWTASPEVSECIAGKEKVTYPAVASSC
jgi:hypothetical protein